jgi:hypothetical protein
MSDSEKALWKDTFGKHPFKERFEPNFLVQINHGKFTEGVIERLRAEGHDTEGLKADPHTSGLPENLLRWVLISLSFLGYSTFGRLLHVTSFEKTRSGVS